MIMYLGKRLVECIIEGKKWPKSLPVLTDRGVIKLVADRMIQASFFHRSEKVDEKKGYFKVCSPLTEICALSYL
jgi:hypothetical protein